ncbi:hypothetical protein DFJ73DRAFT_812378 [Zopfochytrium polystomum]|nr:hypothetical protein DFJ73DRAFT_812378 [Zopfochytrium polystomum]
MRRLLLSLLLLAAVLGSAAPAPAETLRRLAEEEANAQESALLHRRSSVQHAAFAAAYAHLYRRGFFDDAFRKIKDVGKGAINIAKQVKKATGPVGDIAMTAVSATPWPITATKHFGRQAFTIGNGIKNRKSFGSIMSESKGHIIKGVVGAAPGGKALGTAGKLWSAAAKGYKDF